MDYITYSEGYKYQLEENYTVKVDILARRWTRTTSISHRTAH